MASVESLAALGVDPALGALVLVVVGVCVLIVLMWRSTRTNRLSRAVAASPALRPIVGKSQVTHAQLCAWHRAHSETVKTWIENHHEVLDRFSDSKMAIDLTAGLAQGHERLGPAIDEAIAQHPVPSMRAQLSGLALASRNTLDSLRRSNWAKAARDHTDYLEYRQIWLARLDQFASSETHQQEPPSIDVTGEVPPG